MTATTTCPNNRLEAAPGRVEQPCFSVSDEIGRREIQECETA